jgi:hypothetical protein
LRPLKSLKGFALIVILILGLLGGLFHHHESDSDCAACALCHASGHVAVTSLAGTIGTPFVPMIEFVNPGSPEPVAQVLPCTKFAPRAPPLATHLAAFREGCAGLA